MAKPIKVEIKTKFLNDKMVIPAYETEGAAGFDLQANLKPEETIYVIPTRGPVIIPTGIFVAIPKGYELQIRPRSGMAAKQGITVVNSPGTIDWDYRGEVGIILASLATPADCAIIEAGDRIAQAVLKKVDWVEWVEVEELDKTKRGAGGFGSTGKR